MEGVRHPGHTQNAIPVDGRSIVWPGEVQPLHERREEDEELCPSQRLSETCPGAYSAHTLLY